MPCAVFAPPPPPALAPQVGRGHPRASPTPHPEVAWQGWPVPFQIQTAAGRTALAAGRFLQDPAQRTHGSSVTQGWFTSFHSMKTSSTQETSGVLWFDVIDTP